MRWGSEHKYGTIRTVKKFAWLPIRIKGHWAGAQWAWLETVKIEQEYKQHESISSTISQDFMLWLFGGYWVNIRFVPKSEDELRDEKLKKLGI